MKKKGRPTKFSPLYCKKIVNFFEIKPTKIIKERFYYKNGDEKEKEIEVANELPTFEDFAHLIKVDRDTLLEWAKPENKKKYPGFSVAYKQAKELMESIWFKNSLKGLYNPQFAIFAGKNVFAWKDKSEVDNNHTGSLTVIRKSNL